MASISPPGPMMAQYNSGMPVLYLFLNGTRLSSGHKQSHTDAEHASHDDLDGRMAYQFTESLLCHGTTLKCLIDHLIEDTGLDADGTSHTGCIVHDNTCQDHCNSKRRGAHTRDTPGSGGKPGHERRV